MSSPPTKAPSLVRWLSLLAVIVAVAVRFWPHPATESTPTVVPTSVGRSAAPAESAPGAPAPSTHAAYGSAIGFRSHERLVEHFAKHGAEFNVASAEAYLRLAQALRDAPAMDAVLELRRADGVITRFDRANGAFLAFEHDGTIRTFFRPNEGERYFRRQAARGAP